MAETYSGGTKFRFYLNVDNQAYIYAFATDLSGKGKSHSPLCRQHFHIGGRPQYHCRVDTKIIKMDENKGKVICSFYILPRS